VTRRELLPAGPGSDAAQSQLTRSAVVACVIWQLRGSEDERETRAVRFIGLTFSLSRPTS
jgi:hypothetical protein